MAIKDVFKVSWRTFVNPTQWIGVNQIKSDTAVILSTVRDLFVVPKATHKETFEEAIKRLNVDDKQLEHTANTFLQYTIIFITCAAIAFASIFYFFFVSGNILSALLSTCVMVLFLSQALRFDFWHFQIKHRKLGCTFQEWWKGKISNPRGPET